MAEHRREDYFRNIYCPEYDGCLEKAARSDLDLDCGSCKKSKTGEEEFIVSSWDVAACQRLAFVIFHPEAKRRPKG